MDERISVDDLKDHRLARLMKWDIATLQRKIRDGSLDGTIDTRGDGCASEFALE